MPCVTECCHQNSRFPRYSRKTRFQTWRASGNGVLACCHFLLSPHASYRGQLSCRRPQTTHMHGPERSRMPGGAIGTVLRQVCVKGHSCMCLHCSGTVQVQKQFSKPRTDHNSGYSVSARCIAVMGRGHNAVMGRGLAPSHSTSVIPSVLYMFLILLVYGTSERS